MKLVILSIFTLFYCFTISAQHKVIVYFKDKDLSSENVLEQFTERSLKRRIKYNIPFDAKDFPVNKTYLSQLETNGYVKSVSRWLNAAVYETNISENEIKSLFPFILMVREIKEYPTTINKDVIELPEKTISYGTTTEQITQLNLDCLHDLGYQGEGVYLGVIDAGFNNMDDISYFDTVFNDSRVIETYDFVNNANYVYDYSAHGTGVSSCIVGQNTTPIIYHGTAVDVNISLYRSEDADTETIEEEFNLVLALERCDQQGIDIANISLGYVDFDDLSDNHPYSDLDGKTTIAAIGVNTAASKGIAVVAAAGNSGPATIGTPCDADSVLCVGAVDNNGNYVAFSSVGPSADGQVKPDVVARGQDAAVVYDAGEVIVANGTSFASPILCGATACLMQAHPNRSPMEIFDAIRRSASQYQTPDNLLGYGIPDMCAANDYLNATASLDGVESFSLELYPNPTSDFVTIKGLTKGDKIQVRLTNSIGKAVLIKTTNISQGMSVLDIRSVNSGVYFLEIQMENTSIEVKKIIVRK